MSSSESSEDEEEIKKISMAVIPNDLLSTLTSSIPTTKTKENVYKPKANDGNDDKGRNSATRNEKLHLVELAAKFKKVDNKNDRSSLQLKSNRSDKSTEEEDSAYHATTPGFRAHIEKHLNQIMDSYIKARIQDSVWKKPYNDKEKKQSGIKLFSTAKVLCNGVSDIQQPQSVKVVKSPPTIRPRKHKLNSCSSESSDDEDKISACVFTVDDIMLENRMLDDLLKSRVELSNTDKAKDGSESHDFIKNDSNEGNASSKKCKKMKSKHCNEVIQKVDDGKEQNTEMCSVKTEKKKRKKSQVSADEWQESHHIHDDSSITIEKKKKKKLKVSADERQESHHTDDDSSITIEKKKKKKNIN